MEKNLIKKLMASLKCGVCGQRYKVNNVSVLGHKRDLWFLSAFCPTCRTRCLMAAVVKEGGAPKVITDLTEAELGKFKNLDRLSADEVLDMHNFLKDFEGDFAELFSLRQA